MTQTTEAKTTTIDTKRALEQREAEEQRGRDVLAALEQDRTAAATEFAADMSHAKRTKVETLDGKVSEARVTLEALESRTRAAQRVHEATLRAEKVGDLRELVRKASPSRLRRSLTKRLVDRAVETDRAFAKEIDQARAECREQRDLVARAQELALELGETIVIEEVFVDDFRVAAGVAVARARDEDDREGEGAEAFLTPIDRAGEHADHMQYERAVALVNGDAQ